MNKSDRQLLEEVHEMLTRLSNPMSAISVQEKAKVAKELYSGKYSKSEIRAGMRQINGG